MVPVVSGELHLAHKTKAYIMIIIKLLKLKIKMIWPRSLEFLIDWELLSGCLGSTPAVDDGLSGSAGYGAA